MKVGSVKVLILQPNPVKTQLPGVVRLTDVQLFSACGTSMFLSSDKHRPYVW